MASPSVKGVVIDTKLFSKAVKTKTSKKTTNAILPKIDAEYEDKMDALKQQLVEKLLVITEGTTSQGVKDYLGIEVVPKGAKFTRSVLEGLVYNEINLGKWTSDAKKNELIRATVINYLRKNKELSLLHI